MIKKTMICDGCNKVTKRATLLVTLEHRQLSHRGARRFRRVRNPFHGAVDFCASCAKKPIAPSALVKMASARQRRLGLVID